MVFGRFHLSGFGLNQASGTSLPEKVGVDNHESTTTEFCRLPAGCAELNDMKRLVLTVLTCLLGIVTLSAKNTNRPLRVELAEQLRSLGYSLADVYGGDAYVVSVDKRTLKAAKLKDSKKLASVECSSPGGRYVVLHKNGGIWLRDTKSQEVEQVESEGQYSTQCFSPQGKFVYSTGKMVRVHDLAERKSTDIGEGGSFPTWSPDGKWLGFDDRKHYVLLNQTTGHARSFSTPTTPGVLFGHLILGI